MNRFLIARFSLIFGLFLLFVSCEEEEDFRTDVGEFEIGVVEAQLSATNISSGDSITFSDLSTKVQSREWTFPNGTPVSSEDSVVTVIFVNADTVEVTFDITLEILHLDNTSASKTYSVTLGPGEPIIGGGGGGGLLTPLDIAFITDDIVGDQGYLDLLIANGHTVEAEVGKYNNLDATGAAELNRFDLIILSRNTNSGNFSDGARPAWTTVSTPILNLSSFVARSTRLQYFPSENQNEGGGTSIKAVDASHPVFSNVTLDADGLIAVTATALHTVVGIDAGNGTLIGTTADGADAAIAYFDAGIAAYEGGEIYPGKRMFLAGTGGGYTYNDSGAQLFLNSIEFLITGAVASGSGGGGLTSRPLNIAFVTNNVGADQGFADFLATKGHTVEMESEKYANLDAGGAAILNTFDLVIISRSTNSGNFSDGARPAWTTVSTPVLNLSSFVARNTRLHYFNTAEFNEAAGTLVKATDTSHPIFTGISLDADNSIAISNSELHATAIADAGNGTLLGTNAEGTLGIIAIFEPGAAYEGADSFAGKRMFLAGTGDGYSYNEVGAQLLSNCVDFIAN
ncbi:MAG: hypothetical protein RIA69_19485 [Cyclobacteriaceae bacterium]